MNSIFFAYLFSRICAGFRNGAIYASGTKRSFAAVNAFVLLGLGLLFSGAWQAHILGGWGFLGKYSLYLIVTFSLISALGILPYYALLSGKKWAFLDIHFLTVLEANFIFLAFVCGGPWSAIGVCLAVYPALILQKAIINHFSGLDFFATQTDDTTGKTFSIPFLGLKVPRSGISIRIFLAVLSIAIIVRLNL